MKKKNLIPYIFIFLFFLISVIFPIIQLACKLDSSSFNELINSKELDEILDEGRDYATYLARRKMSKVRDRFGIGRKRK